MENLKNKTVLITGGTGSFGKSFAKYLLKNYNLKKLIIFSRDEFKQFELSKEFNDKRVYFYLGDVRDLSRLQRAFYDVDIIIHAAALKQVPTLEHNPFEAVKTNILGTQNVIDAAIDQKVKKVVLVSTDKAAQPANLYGATKLSAEKLFISGNAFNRGLTAFSCVRYGNVIGSRGSIVEVLLKDLNVKKVSVTDERMTRFWLTLKQAHDLVVFALDNMEGGEVFIPKAPSMKLMDLFDALVPDAEKVVTGIRPGEKIHEILLTEQEAMHAVELEDHYVILPEFLGPKWGKKYSDIGKKLEFGFKYTSDLNTDWLTKERFLTLHK